MNNKLYVGNLDYTVTSDQLKDHFATVGAVIDSVVIMDRQSGRSKGFGFVTMETEELAQKAIDALNGKDFSGRNIVVNVARPKTE